MLLDRALTLCALFRIRLQPIGRLGVVRTLLLPQLDDPAQYGPMIVRVPAPETHFPLALARHGRDQLIKHPRRRLRTLDNVFAVWLRAPSHGCRVGHECLVEQVGVPRRDIARNNRFDGLLSYDPGTSARHALYPCALAVAFDLACQVLRPTSTAEPVFTAER